MPELILILVIALVIFGAKNLPDIGKALGKTIQEFRNATSGDSDKSEPAKKDLPPAEKDKDKDSSFEDNLKGEVECTYEGEKEVDGKKLARVALACKATTKMAPSEDDGALQSMDFEFDLEGELLWDAAARHFVSYELGGDVTTKLVIQRKVEAKGQQHDFTIRLELGGKLELEGKAE